MRKIVYLLLFNFCLFASWGCSRGFEVIGLDDSNKVHNFKIDNSNYKKEVGDRLAKINEYTIEALDKISSEDESTWEVKKVGLGLGLEGKVGILDVVSIKAHPRIRLWFSKE